MASTPNKKPDVRLADIAKQAGCTGATVSRVLNGSPLVASAMRERVLKAVADLGYLGNRMARSLATGKTQILGVVMPHCSDSRYGSLVDAINDAALERGYQILLQFNRWSLSDEERAVRHLVEMRAEALLMYVSRTDYERSSFGRWLAALPIPKVAITGRSIRQNNIFSSTVSSDGEMAGRLLGEHLARMGHRRVDLVAGHKNQRKLHAEARALEVGMKRCGGGVVTPRLTATGGDPVVYQASGYFYGQYMEYINSMVESYLDQPSNATAIVMYNEMAAWRLCRGLRRRGRSVPDDVSVACYGTTGLSGSGAVDVTAAEISPAAVAEKAVQIALGLLQGAKAPTTCKVKPFLSLGETVRQVPLIASPPPVQLVRP